MQIRLALAAALTVAAITPASALDFPPRRAGLWENTLHMDGMTRMIPTSQICIDAATDVKMMHYGMHMKASDCEAVSVTGSGNVRVVDSVCHLNGGTQKSHVMVNYMGDASYHMDMQTHFDPPMNGKAESHMTQDAKWMGPCPAGMKPGEMMINGMKINVLDSMQHPMEGGRLTPEQIQEIIKAHQHP
jgi:Protein of unknown function (DUF3617)